MHTLTIDKNLYIPMQLKTKILHVYEDNKRITIKIVVPKRITVSTFLNKIFISLSRLLFFNCCKIITLKI